MNTFNKNSSEGKFDRSSHKRHNREWITNKLTDNTTKFIVSYNSQNLFTKTDNPAPIYLSYKDLKNFTVTPETTIFLGIINDQAVFTIDLSSYDLNKLDISKQGEFNDLRKIAVLLDTEDSNLLVHAKAMIYWQQKHHFCGTCGSPTISSEGGNLLICSNEKCGQNHFPRTDPAIIVLVDNGESCLLGRQLAWPEKMYSTIAGFVEPGEKLEDAVYREVLEETNIKTKEIKYMSSQPWPFPSSLMLAFTAKAESNFIKVDNHELEDACWFNREEIINKLKQNNLKLPSKFSIAFRLIESWFNKGDYGKLRDILDTLETI